MVGVEIDMIVSDSLKALELYEKVFDIERIEVTNFPKCENEVVFSLYGVRFHKEVSFEERTKMWEGKREN